MFKYYIQIIFLLLTSEIINASNADTTKPVLRAIEVRDSTPWFGAGYYRVFHIDSFIVYENQYYFSGHNIKMDSSGNTDLTNIGEEWNGFRNRYFIFHKDSSYGYSFDPHNNYNNNNRSPVESTLKNIVGSNTFECLASQKPDTSSWNDTGTELREVYVQKASNDTPGVQINLYYSSSLNALKTSLNPALDNIKKMKFYKYEYLIQEFYSKKDQKLFPAMRDVSVMKEIIVTNAEEVMQYIAWYKNIMAGSKKG